MDFPFREGRSFPLLLLPLIIIHKSKVYPTLELVLLLIVTKCDENQINIDGWIRNGVRAVVSSSFCVVRVRFGSPTHFLAKTRNDLKLLLYFLLEIHQ